MGFTHAGCTSVQTTWRFSLHSAWRALRARDSQQGTKTVGKKSSDKKRKAKGRRRKRVFWSRELLFSRGSVRSFTLSWIRGSDKHTGDLGANSEDPRVGFTLTNKNHYLVKYQEIQSRPNEELRMATQESVLKNLLFLINVVELKLLKNSDVIRKVTFAPPVSTALPSLNQISKFKKCDCCMIFAKLTSVTRVEQIAKRGQKVRKIRGNDTSGGKY